MIGRPHYGGQIPVHTIHTVRHHANALKAHRNCEDNGRTMRMAPRSTLPPSVFTALKINDTDRADGNGRWSHIAVPEAMREDEL
jgi:hypothetical protein